MSRENEEETFVSCPHGRAGRSVSPWSVKIRPSYPMKKLDGHEGSSEISERNLCHDDVMFRMWGLLNLMVHTGYSVRQEMTAV